MMSFYYNQLLDNFEHLVQKGDLLIESLIGLSIVNYLQSEINHKILDADTINLIAILEKETINNETRLLVTKMQKNSGD